MKHTSFDEPLPTAAADSLRQAARIARERAAQTGVPLVVWKNGRVAHLPVSARKPRKPRVKRTMVVS